MKHHRFRYLASGLLAAGLLGLGLSAWPGPSKGSAGLPVEPELNITYDDPDGPGPRQAGEPRVFGQLVVDFKDEVTTSQVAEWERRYSVKTRLNSIHSQAQQLRLCDLDEARMPEMLAQWESDPLVESVAPNMVYSLPAEERAAAVALRAKPQDGFPNDPLGKYQWHMNQINAQQSWKFSTGHGVVVSVIDTGVGYRDFKDYKALEDLEKTRMVGGYDFVHDRPEAIDDHAHGSHVAGTVAQSTNNGKGVMGVAFDAAIMPIKVLSARGSGTLGDIADGIYFSANHGATVINMSLGGGFAESTLRTAVAKAHAKGVIVVCAAGNSGAGKPGYPAGYDGAVAVSATDFNEELTFYTNHGPAIDIAAPGGDTRSDKNGDGLPDGVLQNAPIPGRATEHDYLWFMGTSMACPHVAGVSALVESLGVTQPDAVERLMKTTARDKGPEGRERGYGAGIVDAQRAVWKAGIEFGFWRLGLGMLLLALPVLAMLRRGYFLGLIAAFPAAVFASSGLFFLPLLMPGNTAHCWTLTTALPSWGLHLLGAHQHGNPLFFSALVPVILSLLAVDIRPLRALVSGLSAGWAAHLLFATFSGTVAVMFMPTLLGQLWMLGNGLFLIFLASVLGDEQP